MDISDGYHLSRAEQQAMIGETVEAVLTDDAVSKLTDAVQADTSLHLNMDGDIIEPSRVIEGHGAPPKQDAPGAVVDHVDRDGKVDVRAFYGDTGMKEREIHTNDHGNRKHHSYGENGEHVHEYLWDENGRLVSNKRRDLSTEEKRQNGGIMQ